MVQVPVNPSLYPQSLLAAAWDSVSPIRAEAGCFSFLPLLGKNETHCDFPLFTSWASSNMCTFYQTLTTCLNYKTGFWVRFSFCSLLPLGLGLTPQVRPDLL